MSLALFGHPNSKLLIFRMVLAWWANCSTPRRSILQPSRGPEVPYNAKVNLSQKLWFVKRQFKSLPKQWPVY